MKRFGYVIVAMALLSATVVAQSGWKNRGNNGWGPGSEYNKRYNTNTVETIAGQITAIDTMTPLKSMSPGIHIVVKTDKEIISVHLGPAWFLENQEWNLEVKDTVAIKGSRVLFNNQPTLIAAEVKKDDAILKLRDENGFPLWNGWHRWKR